MPENFSVFSENKIDVNRIRNFLFDAKVLNERKNYGMGYHLLFALLSAVCVYFAVDGINIGATSPFVLLCLCFGPVLFTFTFLYSPLILKIITILSPLFLFGARVCFLNSDDTFENTASRLFVYLLCILVAAILTKTSLSGITKTSCFVLVTSAYTFMTVCIMVFIIIAENGTFSIKIIDDAFNSFKNSVIDIAGTKEGLEYYRAVLPSTASLSQDELIQTLRLSLEASISAVKTVLPAIIIVTCMFFSFITVELFSVVAKKFNYSLFVCIMDNFWTYRPSSVSTTVYDIVFFAYILEMFIPIPQNICGATINLLLIMSPAMFVPGTRGIYTFFYKRNKNKSKSILICLAIVAVIMMLSVTLGVFIVSSIGVMFVTTRYREEMLILPVKMTADKAAYDKLYSNNPKNASENKDDIPADKGE